MSSQDEQEYKNLKSHFGLESSSTDRESSSEYDGDSENSSYILVSENELLTEESDDIEDEKDYFETTSEEEDSEKSEVAWEDSDDDENLRDEIDEDANWLTADGIQKKIKVQPKKISFKLKRKVFTANCKVKLFKTFPEIKILVDSFNLIYLIKKFDDFKTFKIEFFKISDVCIFGGKILLSSNSSSFMKQITFEGKVSDIKKGTGNIKKMLAVGNTLYILGDKLFAFNSNFNLVSSFNSTFIDFCVGNDQIICLKEDGDIYIFDLELTFKNKVSFPFKFQFKSLYFAKGYFFICTLNGLFILDQNSKEVKSFSNLSEPITAITSNDDFIVHGSAYDNSLRILKVNGLSYFEKFPFSKVRINPISSIAVDGDTFYFSETKFITSLKLSYV